MPASFLTQQAADFSKKELKKISLHHSTWCCLNTELRESGNSGQRLNTKKGLQMNYNYLHIMMENKAAQDGRTLGYFGFILACWSGDALAILCQWLHPACKHST